LIEESFVAVEQRFEETREKQRVFLDLRYGAKSWERRRAVIAKLEVTAQGRNPRFVVTNLNGNAQTLYDQVYLRNTRRIQFLLSSAFPYPLLFRTVAERLVPG